MNLIKAYKMVFDDIVNNGPLLFKGIYDAKNGSVKYMHGICTVMEYILENSNASKSVMDNFSNEFTENMIKSKHGE